MYLLWGHDYFFLQAKSSFVGVSKENSINKVVISVQPVSVAHAHFLGDLSKLRSDRSGSLLVGIVEDSLFGFSSHVSFVDQLLEKLEIFIKEL